MQVIEKGSLDDYNTSTQAVTDVLNSVAGPKRWTTDDIARAHRVGQSRDGQPKPMIVKFNRWKDKMTVLSNRQFRDNLENRGTKAANDLTRNQAAIVAAARRDGKVAFFKKGKLTVEPRRPDSRTYAQVTTADDTGATTNPAQEQPVDRVNKGVICHVTITTVTEIPRLSRTRAESVPFLHVQTVPVHTVRRGPRHSGLTDYWDSRRSPPRSAGNKCQSRNAQPRRSERASTRRR